MNVVDFDATAVLEVPKGIVLVAFTEAASLVHKKDAHSITRNPASIQPFDYCCNLQFFRYAGASSRSDGVHGYSPSSLSTQRIKCIKEKYPHLHGRINDLHGIRDIVHQCAWVSLQITYCSAADAGKSCRNEQGKCISTKEIVEHVSVNGKDAVI